MGIVVGETWGGFRFVVGGGGFEVVVGWGFGVCFVQ